MNVLIISRCNFPNGDAGSTRLLTFGYALRDLGHKCVYITTSKIGLNKTACYDGFEYCSLYEKGHGLLTKITNRYFYTIRAIRNIERVIKTHSINTIIFTQIPNSLILYLKLLASNKGIKLVYDAVEWYSPSQFMLGNLSIRMISKNIEHTLLVNRKIRVIAISHFLYDYFNKKRCQVIRIPVIFDTEKLSTNPKNNGDLIRIIYAGNPGKKDHIGLVIKAINDMNLDDKKKFQLHFYGFGYDSLFNKADILSDPISNQIFQFHGKVKREEICDAYSVSDFSILIRNPRERYAKAGFPTKVVESLAYRTPVICNLSSDLGDYLVHLQNSIISNGEKVSDIKEALLSTLALSKSKRENMCDNSRVTAESNFDYRIYLDSFEKLLED